MRNLNRSFFKFLPMLPLVYAHLVYDSIPDVPLQDMKSADSSRQVLCCMHRERRTYPWRNSNFQRNISIPIDKKKGWNPAPTMFSVKFLSEGINVGADTHTCSSNRCGR